MSIINDNSTNDFSLQSYVSCYCVNSLCNCACGCICSCVPLNPFAGSSSSPHSSQQVYEDGGVYYYNGNAVSTAGA